MEFLERNLQHLCAQRGETLGTLLAEFQVETAADLSVNELQAVAEEYGVDLYALLFKPLAPMPQAGKIKLLIMDVDGVLTDGGMYYTESGDQFKKYNSKDGMAIMHAREQGLQVGIISSAFKPNMVLHRAATLGIELVHAGREPKMDILNAWCVKLGVGMDQVAMIGDDINDLPVMAAVGFRCCPADAVQVVKEAVDVVLQRNGGAGCVRELIDGYLLERPTGA
jgi:YrbI family 3-deoxy-D-manno-octulosonate 8-phosphate phosphatase